jgi:hypothetical protein
MLVAPAEAPKAMSSNAPDSRLNAAAMPTAAIPPPKSAAAAPPPQSGEMSLPSLADQTFDRKIIRNATLALTVRDVDGAVAYVRDTATGAGGYVFSSSTSLQEQKQLAQITLHVPFAQFDQMMTLLREYPGVVEVGAETTSSQDVTREYVDAESRIRTLQSTELAITKLLDQAATMSEIISIQEQLTRVRGEIETLNGRARYLADLSAISTITVTLTPAVVPVVPPPTPAVEPAKRTIPEAARAAWRASFVVLEQIGIVVVAIVVFLWWLAPLAAIGFTVSWLVRSLRNWRRRPTSVTPSCGVSAAGG